MKKSILFSVFSVAFAHCAPKHDGHDHKVHDNTGHTGAGTAAIEAVLIPLATADTLIHNYNEYREHITGDTMSYSSFILNAEALRSYLVNNPDIVTLNVYLGKKEKGEMTDSSLTLVYIGAVDSMGEGGITYNVERPYYKAQDKTPYLLNHSFPCPTCPYRIAAYAPPLPGNYH